MLIQIIIGEVVRKVIQQVKTIVWYRRNALNTLENEIKTNQLTWIVTFSDDFLKSMMSSDTWEYRKSRFSVIGFLI